MKNKYSIFVIEDEVKISKFVKFILEKEGYEVDLAFDYRFDYEKIKFYNLFIIDINLPFVNGFEIAKRIKTIAPEKPIIFLTALNQVSDKIKGLTISEDYITKPFEPLELLARVENMLSIFYPSSIRINDLIINLEKEVITKNREYIHLTDNEHKVFFHLVNNLNIKVSKENLMFLISNEYGDSSENKLNVYINSLRKKLGKESCPIETIYGYGYIIRR
ncbi:response regulator transcription factor [Macrococcoides bohemicum]|uniref:DNA-binding response regulator n=1 Tax=Macrococcoides bohemicum TaxID=1903056 RepID=A0A328A036_9STAP|nr:response regulator transcription factor [Macrococcus bohemicus]RAK47687.1 hypothetical protein BHX94_12590 [Macrococcus bohemicus]